MSGSALDAILCLLLVSAAAVTVAGVPAHSPEPDRADGIAESLASTVAFDYTLAPGANQADQTLVQFDRTSGPEFRRRAHGSLSTLLARVAVRTVRVDGDPVTHAADDFALNVRNATRATLPAHTQVVVRWRPYPDSHLGRRFVIGAKPPHDADVNAATVRAPSGVPRATNADRAARRDGYAGLADVVANALVDGLLPPAQTRLALAGDPPASTLIRYRYRRFAELYGIDVSDPLARGDTKTANDRLAAAVADRVEADLRESFDSPIEAATHLDLGTVDVVVRTWSA